MGQVRLCRAIKSGIWRSVSGIILALLLTTMPSMARDLWPNDLLGFFSVDMRPVQVTLRRNVVRDDGDHVVLEVPRAWIRFASGYDPLKLEQLPDQVETNALKLSLSEPNGLPLSIRAQEFTRAHNVSLSEALKQLRSDTYLVSFFKIDPRTTTEAWKSRLTDRHMGELDGLPYDRRRGTYLSRPDKDEFAEINCTGGPNLITYCDYDVRISPDLMATLTFLDFRFHGGTEYANRRIRSALTVLCHQPGIVCP